MDWLPKFDNPLDFLGTLFVLVGVFLVLAGTGAISVEKVSVKRGTLTWILGIVVGLIGVGFLTPRLKPIPVTPTAEPTSSVAPTLLSSPLPTSATPTPDLKTPEVFLQYYFALITVSRNYNAGWALQTQAFQKATNPGGFNDYAAFWKTIATVDLNSVDCTPLTNVSANCQVDMTLHTLSGFADNTNTTYRLLYDTKLKTWLFDSH